MTSPDVKRYRGRDKCVVCGHVLDCHDGLPPFKCMVAGCDCPIFVPEPATAQADGWYGEDGG